MSAASGTVGGTMPVQAYKVKVEDDDILIEVNGG